VAARFCDSVCFYVGLRELVVLTFCVGFLVRVGFFCGCVGEECGGIEQGEVALGCQLAGKLA